jgi:hypothetical protein
MKPLRCRLRLHTWEYRENPETHEHYQVCGLSGMRPGIGPLLGHERCSLGFLGARDSFNSTSGR